MLRTGSPPPTRNASPCTSPSTRPVGATTLGVESIARAELDRARRTRSPVSRSRPAAAADPGCAHRSSGRRPRPSGTSRRASRRPPDPAPPGAAASAAGEASHSGTRRTDSTGRAAPAPGSDPSPRLVRHRLARPARPGPPRRTSKRGGQDGASHRPGDPTGGSRPPLATRSPWFGPVLRAGTVVAGRCWWHEERVAGVRVLRAEGIAGRRWWREEPGPDPAEAWPDLRPGGAPGSGPDARGARGRSPRGWPTRSTAGRWPGRSPGRGWPDRPPPARSR